MNCRCPRCKEVFFADSLVLNFSKYGELRVKCPLCGEALAWADMFRSDGVSVSWRALRDLIEGELLPRIAILAPLEREKEDADEI